MAVADTTIQDEQAAALSRPDKGEIFLARREDLRLVKTPRYPRFGGQGQKVGEHPGEVIPFRANRFFCPNEGTVQLEDGREVDAAEVLEWLSSHRLLGNAEEGFWRVVQTAPGVSQAETQLLMDAAMALDEAALEGIIATEREGWGRPEVIQPAERALERIAEAKANAAKTAPKKA